MGMPQVDYRGPASSAPRPDTLATVLNGTREFLDASHKYAETIEAKLGTQVPTAQCEKQTQPSSILIVANDLRNAARQLQDRLERIQADLA